MDMQPLIPDDEALWWSSILSANEDEAMMEKLFMKEDTCESGSENRYILTLQLHGNDNSNEGSSKSVAILCASTSS